MTLLPIQRRVPPQKEWPAEDTGSSAALHPVLRRVFSGRGLHGAEAAQLPLKRLIPVGSLDGVDAASRLLLEHRARRVLVIGDFDADGATSTALMVRALRLLQFAHVDFLVPNRFRFGYGLTPEIVALAAARRPSLIVTVDNGVSSVAGAAAARSLGIAVLITDHHLPGPVLPDAQVIVNPNLAGSRFASPALAGVGVAFYVIAALARELGDPDFRPARLLDLVALGTVADVVTLDPNNRILVEQGLQRIRADRCVPGIRALLECAGRNAARCTAADLGFAVAPRLNAAGRLTDMTVGIACLLADDLLEATSLAAQLAQLNHERREIERRMQTEALRLAASWLTGEQFGKAKGVCLYEKNWHQGVVGLVAGRIKDRIHRPVVAFARSEDGSLRGSARSIAGVNIRDALESIATRHPGMIDKFGGHALAAGMSLRAEQFEAFSAAFAAEIAARCGPELTNGVIHSDGALTPPELCIETARALRAAGPWGQGFPEPIFDGEFVVHAVRVLADRHLKMELSTDGAGGICEAIAFGHLDEAADAPDVIAGTRVELAYRLEVNEYRGTERLQLNCQQVSASK